MAQKIRVEMKELGVKLRDILAQAQVKNRKYLVEELQGLPYQALRYIPQTYRESGLQVRIGQLVGSNFPIPLRINGDTMTTGLRNPTGYAAIQELGGQTTPHTILPRFKRALYWPGAAHPVRKVDHPGSKIPARPFVRPAIERAFEDFANKIMGEGGIGL